MKRKTSGKVGWKRQKYTYRQVFCFVKPSSEKSINRTFTSSVQTEKSGIPFLSPPFSFILCVVPVATVNDTQAERYSYGTQWHMHMKSHHTGNMKGMFLKGRKGGSSPFLALKLHNSRLAFEAGRKNNLGPGIHKILDAATGYWNFSICSHEMPFKTWCDTRKSWEK